MPNPLIPPEALEGLMVKAFLEQNVAPGLFWDALLKSDLYVPLASPSSHPPSRTESIDEIAVLLGEDSRGKQVVWLFTSASTLLDYVGKEILYRNFSAPAIFDGIKDSTHEIVLIGPDGLTLNLHRKLVASLAKGEVPERAGEELRSVPKEAEIQVGPPADDREALTGKFKALFESLPEVVEAAFIQIADEVGSRLLLGLRLTEESRAHLKAAAEKVAKAAEGILDKGKSMDITLIEGSLKEAFAKWGETFFKR